MPATIRTVVEQILTELNEWAEWPDALKPASLRYDMEQGQKEGLFLQVIEDDAKYREDSPQPGTHALARRMEVEVIGYIHVRQDPYDPLTIATWCEALRENLHTASAAGTYLALGIGFITMSQFRVGDISEDDAVAITLTFRAGGYGT